MLLEFDTTPGTQMVIEADIADLEALRALERKLGE